MSRRYTRNSEPYRVETTLTLERAEWPEYERVVKVCGTYVPAERQTLTDPGWGAYMEDVEAEFEGVSFDLTAKETKKVEAALMARAEGRN